jgi:hypothetical protein
MRTLLAIVVICIAGAAAGCQKDPPPAPPATRDRPLPADGTAVRNLTSTLDRARVQLDLAIMRAAVKAWKSERGTYPQTFQTVMVDGLSYPADLAYDPATGAVTSKTYPEY